MINIKYVRQGEIVMSKGSGRRKENTKLVEANWDRIFNSKPNDKQFKDKNVSDTKNSNQTKKRKF
jgi:hypothetical protein